MPGKKTKLVENLIRKNDAPSLIRYRVGDNSKYTYTNLVIVDDKEGEKCSFVTNIENINTTSEIFNIASALYSKRWGIETTYRVTKHSFLSKTTSKNPIVRLFYYLLAVSLYNLWQLANMTIPEVNNLKVTKYESQSRIFGTLLKGCLRMLDKGPPSRLCTQSLGTPYIQEW
jgi:IS4 transposase